MLHVPRSDLPLRRLLAPGLGMALLMTFVTGCGGGSGTAGPVLPGGITSVSGGHTTASDVDITTTNLRQVHATVLVTGAGYALYMYVPDHRSAVTCTGLCAASWPPVVEAAPSDVHGGRGVDAALLGAIHDPSGGTVVTYDHWPLYTYTDDVQPGFAEGQGVDANGGYWYLMRPSGAPLVPTGGGSSTPAAPSSAAPTTVPAS